MRLQGVKVNTKSLWRSRVRHARSRPREWDSRRKNAKCSTTARILCGLDSLWSGRQDDGNQRTKRVGLRVLKYILTTFLTILLSCGAAAKCGNSAIEINGTISGYEPGSAIIVQVVPDPNWVSQPPPIIDEQGRFRITVYFDRTKAEGRFRHNCSRKPERVSIEVRNSGSVSGQVALEIKRDFVKANKTDYRVRLPIGLHSRAGGSGQSSVKHLPIVALRAISRCAANKAALSANRAAIQNPHFLSRLRSWLARSLPFAC